MTTRRTFLKLGAASIALPSLLTTAQARLTAVPTVLADDTYPIGFFWPPPSTETTLKRYQQIADAGFTFVNSGNDVNNWTNSLPMMQRCADVGLTALPSDDRIGQATICPGWQDGIKRVRDQYAAASPAFGGFRLIDEPAPRLYPRLRMIADVLRQAGPTDLTHVNLVPFYDPGDAAAYQDFLARYVDQMAPTFISFDHYPLLTDNTLRPTYFHNWALIRRAGLDAGLPTWTYIQTLQHGNMKSPTREELQWQISMSLAYGCKGIQYFTYWTPVGRPDFRFGPALIDANGAPTAKYDWAKTINTTWLQPVGRQLKHLVSESVVHANESPLPLGATAFTPSTRLRSVAGDPVVLGQFRAAADDGRRWLFAANRRYGAAQSANVTITPEVAVGTVEEFLPVSGTYQALPAGPFRFTIAPGSGRLFRLTGAP
ncbi:hypothetical protein ACIA49_00655 [Kribbella sp. NPDC051587]|uniref:hypothetical protein n=1 Tax=Kribbella sp. NPDC051587 TaxID=3364119 RepID=UPI0037A73966